MVSYRVPESIRNEFPRLTQDSHRDFKGLVMRHSMPTIERLFMPTLVEYNEEEASHGCQRCGHPETSELRGKIGKKGKKGKKGKGKKNRGVSKKNEKERYIQGMDGHLPGPACNNLRCSKYSGSDIKDSGCCVCHPYGWYGWRYIPKCCFPRYYPEARCNELFINGKKNPCLGAIPDWPGCKKKGDFGFDPRCKPKLQCALPCHSSPVLCQENFYNPYHQYIGPMAKPGSYNDVLSALY